MYAVAIHVVFSLHSKESKVYSGITPLGEPTEKNVHDIYVKISDIFCMSSSISPFIGNWKKIIRSRLYKSYNIAHMNVQYMTDSSDPMSNIIIIII